MSYSKQPHADGSGSTPILTRRRRKAAARDRFVRRARERMAEHAATAELRASVQAARPSTRAVGPISCARHQGMRRTQRAVLSRLDRRAGVSRSRDVVRHDGPYVCVEDILFAFGPSTPARLHEAAAAFLASTDDPRHVDGVIGPACDRPARPPELAYQVLVSPTCPSLPDELLVLLIETQLVDLPRPFSGRYNAADLTEARAQIEALANVLALPEAGPFCLAACALWVAAQPELMRPALDDVLVSRFGRRAELALVLCTEGFEGTPHNLADLADLVLDP